MIIFFFEDDDIHEFLCLQTSLTLVKIVGSLKSGAGKADIWRLAIVEKYGGIYLDFDTSCIAPISPYISPDDDFVSGLGQGTGFHQWGMIYVPHHPFVIRALDVIIRAVQTDFIVKKNGNVIALTGPDPYMEGVRQILKSNGCHTNEENNVLHTIVSLKTCSSSYPFKIGKMHIYSTAISAINFKHASTAHLFTKYLIELTNNTLYNTPQEIEKYVNKCNNF